MDTNKEEAPEILFIFDKFDRFTFIKPCPLFYLLELEVLLHALSDRASFVRSSIDLEVFVLTPDGESLIKSILNLHGIDRDRLTTKNIEELLFNPGKIQIVNNLVDNKQPKSNQVIKSEDSNNSRLTTKESIEHLLCNLLAVKLVDNIKDAIALAKVESASRINSLIKIRDKQLNPEKEEKKEQEKQMKEFAQQLKSGEMFNDNFFNAILENQKR